MGHPLCNNIITEGIKGIASGVENKMIIIIKYMLIYLLLWYI